MSPPPLPILEREAAWLDPDVLDRLPASDDPQAHTEHRQRLRMITLGLQQIAEDLAQLVILRDFAGLSYQEIADALQLPLGTVKSRLNRARIELATAVRRRLVLRAVGDQPGAANGSVS